MGAFPEVDLLPKRDFVVGLDIGTSKVCVVTAEVASEGQVNVIGVGTSPSTGMRKGVVVDIDGIVRSISAALEQAERMAGVEIKSAFTGITGAHISSLNNRGVVAVGRDDKEITQEDVDRVMDAARVLNIPSDREIIHVLPREFVVDGYDGVRDPVGMMGVRLEVEAQIVTGAVTSMQNLLRAVYKSGLEVDDVVLAPLASGEAVLHPAERELGVNVIDIGGGTTDLAIFEKGTLWHASVLPLGGDHITNDIAVGLRTPLFQAEKIKIDYGVARASMVSEDSSFLMPLVGGTKEKSVSRAALAGIIEPRVQEILLMVDREVKKAGYGGVLPGGVVVTGGSSLLPGLVDCASEVLDMPVRLGVPGGIGGLRDVVSSPAYATAVGLVLFAARERGKSSSRQKEAGGGLFDRIKNWFREFF